MSFWKKSTESLDFYNATQTWKLIYAQAEHEIISISYF